MNSAPPVPGASAGSSAVSTRHATSATAGSSAADRSALAAGGASLWASGSQLCTGAHPTFVARPAMMSTNAVSAPASGSDGATAAIARQSSVARSPPSRAARE